MRHVRGSLRRGWVYNWLRVTETKGLERPTNGHTEFVLRLPRLMRFEILFSKSKNWTLSKQNRGGYLLTENAHCKAGGFHRNWHKNWWTVTGKNCCVPHSWAMYVRINVYWWRTGRRSQYYVWKEVRVQTLLNRGYCFARRGADCY